MLVALRLGHDPLDPELFEVIGNEDGDLDVVPQIHYGRVKSVRDYLVDDFLADGVSDVGSGHIVLVMVNDGRVLVNDEDLAARIHELFQDAPSENTQSDYRELLH